MKIYIEVQPTRFREKFIEELKSLEGTVERIHIPDAPFGYPKSSPLALASIAIAHGFKVTIHIRTMDYNEVGLLNILYGAYLIGVDRIVLLYGDKPVMGSSCGLLTSESALDIYLREERLRKNIKAGFLLSMRYNIDEIKKRIVLPADFFLVLNKDRNKCELLRSVTDKELIGYMIVSTPTNKEYLMKWANRKDVIDISLLRKEIDEWSSCFDSFLISAPKDTAMLSKELNKIM